MKALKDFRFKAPGAIVAIASLPWLFINIKNGSIEFNTAKNIIYPLTALIFSILYISFKWRDPLWNEELDNTVRKQIKNEMTRMIEARLTLNKDERNYIYDKKVFNDLNGLFWNTIANDQSMNTQKEKFYQNGRWYSTWMDIFIIYSILGYLYIALAGISYSTPYLSTGVGLLLISLFAWYCFIPIYRKEHLRLSKLQLEDIEDRLLDPVLIPLARDLLRMRRA